MSDPSKVRAQLAEAGRLAGVIRGQIEQVKRLIDSLRGQGNTDQMTRAQNYKDALEKRLAELQKLIDDLLCKIGPSK